MPATVKKQGEKYRVVESSTGKLVLNPAGTPVDGGGHDSYPKASAQARAINSRKNLEESIIHGEPDLEIDQASDG